MPVKYECSKCRTRYVDWGAEKLGYRCPDCEDGELIRIGSVIGAVSRKPSLKRAAASPKAAARIEPSIIEPKTTPLVDPAVVADAGDLPVDIVVAGGSIDNETIEADDDLLPDTDSIAVDDVENTSTLE